MQWPKNWKRSQGNTLQDASNDVLSPLLCLAPPVWCQLGLWQQWLSGLGDCRWSGCPDMSHSPAYNMGSRVRTAAEIKWIFACVMTHRRPAEKDVDTQDLRKRGKLRCGPYCKTLRVTGTVCKHLIKQKRVKLTCVGERAESPLRGKTKI